MRVTPRYGRYFVLSGVNHTDGEVHDGCSTHGLDGAGESGVNHYLRLRRPFWRGFEKAVSAVLGSDIIDTPATLTFTIEVEAASLRVLVVPVGSSCTRVLSRGFLKPLWRQATEVRCFPRWCMSTRWTPRRNFLRVVRADLSPALGHTPVRSSWPSVRKRILVGQVDLCCRMKAILLE